MKKECIEQHYVADRDGPFSVAGQENGESDRELKRESETVDASVGDPFQTIAPPVVKDLFSAASVTVTHPSAASEVAQRLHRGNRVTHQLRIGLPGRRRVFEMRSRPFVREVGQRNEHRPVYKDDKDHPRINGGTQDDQGQS
ncbi:hypothetical protein D9M70_461190 [compost metagenome]